MVAAVREGWQTYLTSPAETNTKMHTLNPSMDAATFTEVAEAQKSYIETGTLGTMTAARWETLIALRKIAPGLPVILTSGYDEAHVMADAYEERPQGFLGKPYETNALRDVIRHALAATRKN